MKPRQSRTIVARYPTDCMWCKKPIDVGEETRWKPGHIAVHLACWEEMNEQGAKLQERTGARKPKPFQYPAKPSQETCRHEGSVITVVDMKVFAKGSSTPGKGTVSCSVCGMSVTAAVSSPLGNEAREEYRRVVNAQRARLDG
jgi:transcription elongation factor Elf1